MILVIEKLIFPGKSLARCEDGRVVFWEGGLPGDRCEVEIQKDKGRFLEATLMRILEPSPLRHSSPCEYSATCGGCQWLEAPYAHQTAWKKAFVEDSLQRIGKIAALPPVEFVPSAALLGYRNRILLRGHVGGAGQIQVGFFASASHNMVPISQCQVASAPINEVVLALSKMRLPDGNKKFRCQIQEIAGEKAEPTVLVLLEPIEKPYTWVEPLRAQLAAHPRVAWVGMQGEKPPFFVFEKGDRATAFTLPGIFQQITTAQNQIVRTRIAEHVHSKKPRSLLDLYCGAGNFSLQFAEMGIEVTGVEFSADSIRAAQHTVATHGWQRMTYVAQDAERYLREQKVARFDYLLVDPPRSGMKELVPHLLRLRIPSIAYVSCNPTTLARDLGQLLELYEIASVTAFDFFPHTYHVETLVFLSLRAI